MSDWPDWFLEQLENNAKYAPAHSRIDLENFLKMNRGHASANLTYPDWVIGVQVNEQILEKERRTLYERDLCRMVVNWKFYFESFKGKRGATHKAINKIADFLCDKVEKGFKIPHHRSTKEEKLRGQMDYYRAVKSAYYSWRTDIEKLEGLSH